MIRLNKLSYVIRLNIMYGYYLALHVHHIIILIVLVLLSATEAQLHKILAIVATRYDFGLEASKQERKVSI